LAVGQAPEINYWPIILCCLNCSCRCSSQRKIKGNVG